MDFDLTKILQMAAELQKMMAEKGQELESKIYEGEAGGGLVKVRANGRGELVAVEIDPQLVADLDRAMIQDLIVAAANQSLAQVKAGLGLDVEGMMQGLAGGFKGGEG